VPLRRQAETTPTFLIVTGMSGAGRTEVANALEDLGYFVVDNLPPAFMSKMVELALARKGEPFHMAFVIDVRGGVYFEEMAEALKDLAKRRIEYRIMFLTASDAELVRRYEKTKRRHPLADRVVDGIAKERALLSSLRQVADIEIDTSDLNVHELRRRVVSAFGRDAREHRMPVTVISFGYKNGIPLDADLVLDVRFLDNPYWVQDLRSLDGRDQKIKDFVLKDPHAPDFLARLSNLLDGMIPAFLEENRRFLTIAIGCTGGKHRSVVCAEAIAEDLVKRGLHVSVQHRDIEQE
jgi:RNase adapter protein RapZ